MTESGWSKTWISPGHDGWDNNMVLDLKGRPHTVSIDPKQFVSSSGIEYAFYDGDSWTVKEVGSGPIAYEFGTAIALDISYNPQTNVVRRHCEGTEVCRKIRRFQGDTHSG